MQASAHTQAAASQRSSTRRTQTRSVSSRPPRKTQQFRPFSGSNERANVIPKAAATEVTGKVVDVELLDSASQSYAVVVDLGNGKQGVGTVSSAIKLGDSVTATVSEGVGDLAALSIVDAGNSTAAFETNAEAALAGFSNLQAEFDAAQQAWTGLPVSEPAHEEVVDELVRYMDTLPEGSSLQVGDQLTGTVVAVSPSGVVVDLGEGVRGLVRVTDLKVPTTKVAALGLPAVATELHALLAASKAGDEAAAKAAAAKLLARKAEVEAEGAKLDAEAEKLLGSLGAASLDTDANASMASVLTPEAYKQVTDALAAAEGISSEDDAAVKAGLSILGGDGASAADDSDVDVPTDAFDAPEYSLTYGSSLEGYEALPVVDASAVYAVGDSLPVYVKDLQLGYAFLTQYTAEEEKASALATVAEFADEEGDEEVADAAAHYAFANSVAVRVPPSADALAAAQYSALDKALAAALSAEQKARLDSIRDKVMLDGALTPSDEAFMGSLSSVLSSNEAVLNIVGRGDGPAVDTASAQADEEGLLADLVSSAGEEAAESIKALLNELATVEEPEGVDTAEMERVLALTPEALQQEVARLLEGQDLPEEGSLDLLADVKAIEKLAGIGSLAAEFQSVLGDDAEAVSLEALVADDAEDDGDDAEALLAELAEEDLGEDGATEEDMQEVTDGMARMAADESKADSKLGEWDQALPYAAADDQEDLTLEREVTSDLAADLDDASAAAIGQLDNLMAAAEQSASSAAPSAAASVAAAVTEPFEIPSGGAAAPAPKAAAPPAPKAAAPAPAPQAAEPAPSSAPVQKPAASAGPSAKLVKELRDKTGAGMMDCKKALSESGNDLDKATEYLRKKGLLSAGKKAGRTAAEGLVQMYVHPDARFGILMEVNCETDFVAGNQKFYELVSELCTQLLPDPSIRFVSVEDVPEEVLAKEREIEAGKEDLAGKPEAVKAKMVEGRVQKNLKEQSLLEQKFWKDDKKTVADVIKEAISSLGENIKVRRFQRVTLGEGIEKKEANLADEVAAATQVAPKAPKVEAPKEEAPKPKEEAPAAPAVQVSAKAVKELRDQTGAGMMDCKKALAACGGDPVTATEWLRKKGLAGAAKKAGRTAGEGLIVGYLHPDCRFGVLVEANCETDFVAGNEKFYQFAQSIAVSIASNKDIQYVSVEDIPAAVLEAERKAALTNPDLEGKPEEIKAKIVEGRVAKAAEGMSLMNQPYVYDQDKTVGEVVKETISQLGENIKIRRFLRYDLGSGIERKEANLAAEVAAMTGSS